jgi:serine/threonine-protein kinase
MRPQPGELINGKYRLVRLIGDGGMGSVFEARHEYLGTAVALKFLHPELARRPGLVARFLREARLSASIKSHHIAHVTDVDQATDGVAYLVMELLEGQSLMTILERERKLPLDVALDYTLQMLAGLEAAHAAGVVHRDLKPDNVFVVKTPRGPLVKLLDFGIAKLRTSKEFQVALTRPGVMMGTPEYMAPEQAFSADTVDARADVYSIGAMLYEMLAGTRPAHGESAQQIAAFILGAKVTRLSKTNPSVSEGLADVVHRAMAPSPADRFRSAAELRDALLPFCGSLSLAGRLAATPSDGGGGVAPTWPPDEQPDKAATKAQIASTEQRPNPHAATEAAAWPPVQAPAPPADYNPPAYGFQPPAVRAETARATTTHARGPRRLSVWLLLVMVGLAVGIVVVALAMNPTPTRREPSRVATPTATTPSPTAASPTASARAATAPPTTIAPPVQPPKEPTAPAANRPASKPQHAADAGTEDAAPNVGLPGLPPFPFPLPSAFPFPSALPLPPLPSGFPPFGIPGFPQPAPAGSQ